MDGYATTPVRVFRRLYNPHGLSLPINTLRLTGTEAVQKLSKGVAFEAGDVEGSRQVVKWIEALALVVVLHVIEEAFLAAQQIIMLQMVMHLSNFSR